MDKLLELLYSQRQFSALAGYSLDISKIYLGSVNVYAWRIAAYNQLGQMDLVRSTIESAKQIFDEAEIRMLDEKLASISGVICPSKKENLMCGDNPNLHGNRE